MWVTYNYKPSPMCSHRWGGFGVLTYSTTKPIDVQIHCTITKQPSFGTIRVFLLHNLKQSNF
jgi:hypothetical protein